MTMKLCRKCNVEKNESEFGLNGKTSSGSPRLRSVCKICSATVNLARYESMKSAPMVSTCVEKQCTKCLVIKPADQYSGSPLTRDRLQSWCRTCSNEKTLQYHHDKRASMTPDELDQVRAKDAADKKVRYASDREFRETCKQHTRAYYQQHRDQCVAASVERERELCLDPVFRLNKSIRTQISQGLKLAGLKKDRRSHQYLGISFEEFGLQLEHQFEHGMSFSNYGRASGAVPYWEIGHIRPIASFDLTCPEQLNECWNHLNLRPQWQQENIKMGAWFEGVDFKGLDASQYCCRVITTEQAVLFTQQHHYTGSAPAITTVSFGLYRKDSDSLLGVGMWMPAQLSAASLVHPEAPQRVLSLSRFSLIPDAPKNAASYFLGQQTRMIRKTDKFSCLISYADQAEKHEGTIYRAAGWKLHGMSAPTTRWIQDGAVVSQRSGTESLTREQMLASGAIDAGKSQKLRFILKFV